MRAQRGASSSSELFLSKFCCCAQKSVSFPVQKVCRELTWGEIRSFDGIAKPGPGLSVGYLAQEPLLEGVHKRPALFFSLSLSKRVFFRTRRARLSLHTYLCATLYRSTLGDGGRRDRAGRGQGPRGWRPRPSILTF